MSSSKAQQLIARAAPRHIAVRCVNWLGDAVMTTPALQRLRERFPSASITLVTREKLADLWSGEPGITGVMAIQPGEGVIAVARRLRQVRADMAIILPNSARSALEARLAGIPTRVGFGGGGRQLLLTHVATRPGSHTAMHKRTNGEIMALLRAHARRKTYPPAAHQVHEYLALVGAAGADTTPSEPRLHVSRKEVEAAVEKFGLQGEFPGARPLVALNPGAEYGPAKRWPAERFIATALRVQEVLECAWVIVGGKSDQPLSKSIHAALKKANAPVLDLAGMTTLRELCALLKLCRAVLTNDTGPMHLAAAVGTRVIVPFGSTSPELTGPGLPGAAKHSLLISEVPCAPCFRRECPIDLRCLKQITPAQASAAIIQTLRTPA